MKKILFTIIFFLFVNLLIYALTEEEVYNERSERLSLFSFSDDVSEIERAIQTRTGRTISLTGVIWNLNNVVSENIKNAMNRLNVNYAMAVDNLIGRSIIIYRRVEDRWFTYSIY